MIRIGTAGLPSVTKNSFDAIDWLYEHGLDAMEVEFVHGVRMSADTARKIGEKAKGRIALSVHAPYYINLCNPEKVDASMKRIIDSAKIAEVLGANVVVIHPGFYGKLEKDECYNMVLDAFEKMTKETNVNLGLELMGKVSQFGTLDEIIKISKEVKGCVPVIDFAHAYARNLGKINYEEILEKMKSFKHIHAHFSGIRYGPKGEINHEPIGHPNFTDLAKLLKKKHIDITLICESPLLEKDALKMKEIVNSV